MTKPNLALTGVSAATTIDFGEVFYGTQEACLVEAERRNLHGSMPDGDPKWVAEPAGERWVVLRYAAQSETPDA